MKRVAEIPKKARIILFDPNKDHPELYGQKVHRYENFAGFCRALSSANKSGKGFAISYTGRRTIAIYDKWCQAVLSVLDGRKFTYLITEEYGRVCRNAGALDPESAHSILWSESRKYGGIMLCTSQRPQTISKDATENAGIIWAGKLGLNASKRVAEEIDIKPELLRNDIVAGEFFYWSEDSEAKKIKVFTPINS